MTIETAFNVNNKEETCRNISGFLYSVLTNPNPHPDWSKDAFLRLLHPESRILDLGCGNQSPLKTKSILPNCYYIGLDVGDYNQPAEIPADEYIIVSPEEFNNAIVGYEDSVDAVISSHNIEHCLDRYGVVAALAK